MGHPKFAVSEEYVILYHQNGGATLKSCVPVLLKGTKTPQKSARPPCPRSSRGAVTAAGRSLYLHSGQPDIQGECRNVTNSGIIQPGLFARNKISKRSRDHSAAAHQHHPQRPPVQGNTKHHQRHHQRQGQVGSLKGIRQFGTKYEGKMQHRQDEQRCSR